jgi:hypothetical protein
LIQLRETSADFTQSSISILVDIARGSTRANLSPLVIPVVIGLLLPMISTEDTVKSVEYPKI